MFKKWCLISFDKKVFVWPITNPNYRVTQIKMELWCLCLRLYNHCMFFCLWVATSWEFSFHFCSKLAINRLFLCVFLCNLAKVSIFHFSSQKQFKSSVSFQSYKNHLFLQKMQQLYDILKTTSEVSLRIIIHRGQNAIILGEIATTLEYISK